MSNAAPVVLAVGATVDEGSPATVSAQFSDPGSLDTHTAVVDWGDGQQTIVGPVSGPFNPTHVYAESGIYSLTVTVTDDDGGSGTKSAAMTVLNLPPLVQTL